MENQISKVAIVAVVVLALLLGVAGGVILDRQVLSAFVPLDNIPAEAEDDFELMAEAWNMIQNIYVDRTALEGNQITYGAISGMIDALGDTGHSRFMSPETRSLERRELQAEFEGIGATVQKLNGVLVVVAPMDNSPAQEAGIKPGDILISADGVDLAPLTVTEAVSHILGPAGTQVLLVVMDPETGEVRELSITRAKLEIKNVTWQTIPGTTLGYVRISRFSDRVGDDLEEALTAINEAGLTGVVLDLRNNPGGLLEQSVQVASQFLSEGVVLRSVDAKGEEEVYDVRPGGVATSIPLVVLINQGSASASEIVAGAMQDAGRAQLVGETTFGTGTVLNTFPLSDGSALLLATEQWLTPSGRVIWHQGIEPDLVVELPQQVIPLSPDAVKSLTPAELQESGDAQLLRALEVLGQVVNQ